MVPKIWYGTHYHIVSIFQYSILLIVPNSGVYKLSESKLTYKQKKSYDTHRPPTCDTPQHSQTPPAGQRSIDRMHGRARNSRTISNIYRRPLEPDVHVIVPLERPRSFQLIHALLATKKRGRCLANRRGGRRGPYSSRMQLGGPGWAGLGPPCATARLSANNHALGFKSECRFGCAQSPALPLSVRSVVRPAQTRYG